MKKTLDSEFGDSSAQSENFRADPLRKMATDEPVAERTRSRIEDIEAARDLGDRMDLLHNRLLRLVPRSEPEVKVESEPKD